MGYGKIVQIWLTQGFDNLIIKRIACIVAKTTTEIAIINMMFI